MNLRFLGLALAAVLLVAGCKGGPDDPIDGEAGAASTPAASGAAPGKVHKLASGLQYEDVVVGSGKMAEPGMNVLVNYTGRLTDGTEFDSSVGKQPYGFQLGSGSVIAGWEEGIKGMRIGGKRKLVIPPDLGYGPRGMGGVIPPNATLLFDVELVDVK